VILFDICIHVSMLLYLHYCARQLLTVVAGIAAQGHFTYWSQRTFARGVNCGLRLDYFICSENMFSELETTNSSSSSAAARSYSKRESNNNSANSHIAQVLDSYILHEDTVGCSDHCPIVLIVRV
jgi:exonuclease III